jgi:hypothetical protein
MDTITKKDAKAAGLRHYRTGHPCMRGHVCERLVSTSACVECNKEKGAKFRAENPEYQRANYAENRDKVNAASRAWQAANPDKVKARKRAYYAENLDKERARGREWRDANPAKTTAQNANLRAREHGVDGTITADDIARQRAKQGGRCNMCGVVLTRENEEIDHK